ncbi:PQQ-binding-like beta-propeller repeat protein [Halorarius halobius]|uniref:outer membrane protein assembly factor BamB family protein n=1 Tax=Halorarius halobius TaxID=2962671 RepID=UPI0020CDD036|nr:PQQ-binding-like beta-propeller repeat protein [Halorarius halobius]
MPSRRRFLAATSATLALGGCIDSIGSQPTPTTPADLGGSWSHVDADAQGSRATDTPAFESPPAELWSVTLDGTNPQVRLADGHLVTGTDARIAGRSLEDGTRRWTYAFEESGHLGAALDVETLYATAGEREPELRMLGQRNDGDAPMVNWADPGFTFRRADPELVVATAEDALVGLDPSDGSERWRLSTDDLSVSAARFGDAALGPDHAFVAAENSGSVAWVYGLDRATGDPQWHHEGPNHAASLTVTDDRVLAGGFYGKVQGWRHDGSDGWTAETTPPVGSIAARDGRVFASKNGLGEQGDPAITALDTDGSKLWTRTTGGVSAVDSGAAYVVDDGVVAVDPASGETRWSLDTAPGSVVPADGGLFVLSAADDGVTLRLFT